jgi:phosphohistidine phosphatase SixA
MEFAKIFKVENKDIFQVRSLYLAMDLDIYEQSIGLKSSEYDQIFLFGHNPGLTEYVKTLEPSFKHNLTKTAIVGFKLKKENELTPNNTKLEYVYYPKKIKP